MHITKAFFAVAGWGTRRLPLTKAIEKCMVPIGNRPLIDYAVQDAIDAGVNDIYFIVGEQSEQLQAYYRDNIALNDYLLQKGKQDMFDLVRPPQNVRFHYLTQPSYGKYGTTVPLALCRTFVDANEQFLLIMGDQSFYKPTGVSNARLLMDLVEKSGTRAGLLGVEVPKEEVQKYGVIETDANGNFVQIVEHPDPETAPSNLNNASFYLLEHAIFDLAEADLARTRTPEKPEYWITDVLNEYVNTGKRITVGTAEGIYIDGGTVEGWLAANNLVLRNNNEPLSKNH